MAWCQQKNLRIIQSPICLLDAKQKHRLPSSSMLSTLSSVSRSLSKNFSRTAVRNLSTTNQDVTRDLFFAFAQPGTETCDPYLSTDDLKALLNALGERPTERRVQDLIRQCDSDGDGQIDLSEFIKGQSTLLKHEDSVAKDSVANDIDHFVSSFGTLDKNGDGFVCADDLTGLLSTVGGHLSRDDAENIIQIADTDDDQKLNIFEFTDFSSNKMYSDLSWRLRSGFRAILVIGGPGSGKGLLCDRLVKKASVDHLSSGDLLREEVASGSALGQSCIKTMQEGKLLPSSTIMAMLKKNMAGHPGHYIALDGFPRSADNCRDFEDIMGAPEMAFYIDVPDDVMIERILKRGEESGRADDNVETAHERLKTFHAQGKPTLDYLKNSGVPVYTLDGTQTPEHVWLQLINCNTPLTKRIVTNRD